MNKKIITAILFTGIILMTACQKDIDMFVPDAGQLNGPDTAWQTTVGNSVSVALLKSSLLKAAYQDTINVNTTIATVNTPFGLQVNFPANCCVNGAGQPVTGKVDVEIQLAKNKGDLIRMDKPSTNNDTMMITAGELFVSLKKDNQLLQLKPGVRFSITYADQPTIQQMGFYMGDESNPQYFNWLPTPEPSQDTIITSTQSYQVYSKRLGWISIAQPFDVSATVKVNVSADMPAYFTNSNTIAFTVFKDLRSVVAMKPDLTTRKFITGKLPAAKAITVVVISKLGSDYYLGSSAAVTQAVPGNSTIQQVQVVPVKKTFAQILSYLDTL